MTNDEMGRVLTKLNAGWPDRKPMPDPTLEMWHDELAPLDFPAACGAARALAREAQYFPKPAEFQRAYHIHKQRQTDNSTRPAPCPFCDGGWVIVVAGSTPTVRPCERCCRQQYDTWRRGGFRPRGGHADAIPAAS